MMKDKGPYRTGAGTKDAEYKLLANDLRQIILDALGKFADLNDADFTVSHSSDEIRQRHLGENVAPTQTKHYLTLEIDGHRFERVGSYNMHELHDALRNAVRYRKVALTRHWFGYKFEVAKANVRDLAIKLNSLHQMGYTIKQIEQDKHTADSFIIIAECAL